MADTSRMKPELAVHLDGKKLEGEEAAALLAVRVYQTRMGASSFELVVSDPDLEWQDKPTFTECKEVKIELGVPGKLKTVFDGEVTAWRTELERSGPTVLVVRGLDRSHRMMRSHKTKTYTEATPLDCVQQIAGNYGLTAKTRAGSPAPVKTFRFQANQTDFEFLRGMAELEGYLFWIDGKDLHFERPQLSDTDDCEFSFGQDLETFLPTANFRKPAVSVEVGAWDVSGKAEITGKAKTGDELWTVPGGKPGAKQAKFTSTKTELSLVESKVATKDHADTVARAALTRRAMEFLTAEVEVQGTPAVKPGAMVNLKKLGPYSGHYLVTEANHFYDAAGYHCIFYVARDKWGDSSNEKEKEQQRRSQAGAASRRSEAPYQPPRGPAPEAKKEPLDFTLHDDQGNALPGVKVKLHFADGEVVDAVTDGDGKVHLDERPPGSFTVEVPGAGASLTEIRVRVEDPEGNPVTGASGKVALADGSEVTVMTDVKGEVHLTDVPGGEYTFTLDADDREQPEEEEPEAKDRQEEQDDSAPEATASLVGRFGATHFETDKTLPLPSAIPTFRQIATFAQKEPQRTLLVVGHTDSQGALEHNRELSLERARAVAAYFRNDVDAWIKYYAGARGSKQWGAREDQVMLGALGYASVDDLRSDQGIDERGPAGPKTRRALIEQYMAADGTSTPDAVDIQTLGCADWHKADPAATGSSAKNRRVEVFAFEKADFQPPASECKGHGGSGDKGTCTAWDRWIGAARELGDAGEGPPRKTPKPKPEPEPDVDIEAIAGPSRVVAGREAKYTIEKDGRAAAKRSRPAAWELEVFKGTEVVEKIDCSRDPRFEITAGALTLKSVPGQWSHREIRVRAYAADPAKGALAKTTVSFAPIVFSDSWTEAASQHHKPGVGDDITFGDVSETSYRAIGKTFDADFSDPGGLGHKTDAELFKILRDMAADDLVFSFSHGELVSNTRAMIDKFKKSDSGGPYPGGVTEYGNAILTRHAREHESTRRFVRNVRSALAELLKANKGDAATLPRYGKRIPSPVYNTRSDKWDGLTIAVNDTWAYEVKVVDYELTGPTSYRARVDLVIYDHFGLNQADIDGSTGKTGVDDPGNHEGFRAWFLLQHVKGYRPFVTRIEFEETFEDSF